MKDNSPSAFPYARFGNNGVIDWGNIHEGMTLRDYFAGQYLAGLSANDRCTNLDFTQTAKECYQQADSMLSEREK